MSAMTTTGLSLKLQRVSQDVKAIDLAARMGVQPSAVSRIEHSRVVAEKWAERYLTALATFATVANDTDASQPAA